MPFSSLVFIRLPRFPEVTVPKPKVEGQTQTWPSCFVPCWSIIIPPPQSPAVLRIALVYWKHAQGSAVLIPASDIAGWINYARRRLSRGIVTSNVYRVRIAQACLCSCVPKHTSSNSVRTERVYHALAQYGAHTLVKQTGLFGTNVLGHGMDGQMWLRPKFNLILTSEVQRALEYCTITHELTINSICLNRFSSLSIRLI